ncbi:MAG: protein kinase domain-containing protein, partial [Gemmatimonadales bacterium]
MATVYVAEDLKHHRRVAVKVLRPELAAAMGAERFLREIDTTANLRHPHILPLFDSGEADGFLFYVMPLVEGESLRDRLARDRQLPIVDALQIGREVADALNYAHAHGVVHRDIKPENILLEGGHAVVADFGIARAITTAGGASLTETGIAVGTPSYMSPEQAAGNKDLDGRSDQYALGCLLYEMLAGQPPFTGPTAQSVVHQHFTSEARPITDIRPGVSREVAAALTRALAKTPADRFDSLGRLAEALQARDAEPAHAARPSRLVLGLGIAVVAAVLLGAVLLTRRDAPTLQLGRRTQVTLDPGLELDPALSPDGRFLAYSGSNGELMVRQVEAGTALRVVREGNGAGRWPTWVPDGQRLLFVSPRGVEVVSALGGTPRLLMPAPGLERGLAVSPDGRAFAWVSHDSLQSAPLDGGPARLVTLGHEMHSLAWSPDGHWIAYVSGNIQYVRLSDIGNIAPSGIWLAPAAGGASRQVSDSGSLNASPAWASARSLLYVSNREGGRDVYQLELSGAGDPHGAPHRLTTGLNAHGISVSPNGGRLAYSSFTESSNVWTLPIPATGAISVSRATQVTVGNQTIENLDVSADGAWVGIGVDRDGRSQIYRARIGDMPSEPRQVSRDSTGAFWVAWSRDGKEIASHR